MKITAKTIASLALPPGKTDIIHFDDMRGFGYRVRLGAGGKVLRSWVVQFKRAGATRRITLGSAEVLGAEAARAAAKKLLGKVANGEDPQAERRDRRGKDRVSLKSMIDEYLLQKESRIRPRTFTEVKRYLSGDYFKPLFGMPVDQIGRKDIAARLVTITREHGTIPAARARATLSAFFVWCLQSGLTERNPVVGTLRPRDSAPRERVLSLDELASVWRACDASGEYGKIVRLLILLAARRGEVGGMCWSEFSDLDGPRPTWTLPARRSKNGRRHVLPLGATAVDIIKSVPRMVSRDALFGGRAGCFTAWGRGKPKIDAASAVTVPWTLHDLRRSTATHLGDMNIAPHIVEEVLGHAGQVRSAISRVYNKSRYFAEVHTALTAWEDRVRALVDGTERKVLAMTPSVAP